ncbi:MAG: hypothetical protein M0Q38_03335 [Bacteroidales bacterium]|nr:hypothetical protein [Bacteroidales bacterium]
MWKLLLPFLFVPVLLHSQPVIPLGDSDFPGALVTNPTAYDPESIWNYMNTGVDLYLEYGFKSVLVQEIVWEHEKVKAEVYRMGSPEEAFGIYSLLVINCLQRDTIDPYNCTNLFQYQEAYGDLYISITCESVPELTRKHYLPVTSAIKMKNQEKVLDLPATFNLPAVKKGRGNLAYIQGPVGLQNCMFPIQDLFLSVRFGMYATLLTQPDNDVYFARISFETPGDMFRFLGYAGLMQGNVPIPNTNRNDGLYREYKQLDAQTIYFLQSQVPFPIDGLINLGQ